ncbi:MAG: hypothetical protein IJ398_03575 [Clostridia bacterium]|nr:hypothetical protein [Clostridia bacterium]
MIYYILASIFLFNPMVSNIDVLPDIFAYILIMIALSKPAYTNDVAEQAYVGARKMAIITLIKLFSLLLISGDDITMSLLLSFTFMIVELIFGIPFFISLFKYLSHIALMGNNATSANKSDKIRIFTIAFTIVKLLMATLPDFTALSLSNGVDSSNNDLSLTYFRPTLFIISVTIAMVLGIIWLIFSVIYYKSLFTKEVREKIRSDFTTQMSNRKSLFEAKSYTTVMLIMALGSFFALDIGGFDIILTPDFLVTLTFIISFFVLYIKGYFKPKWESIVLIVSFIGQVIFYILESVKLREFYDKFNLESVLKSSKADTLYSQITLFGAIESAFFVLSIAIILYIIAKNGKESLEKHAHLFIGCDYSFAISEYKEKMKKNIILTGIFTLLSALTYVIMVAIKPTFPDFIMVNMICEVALAILLAKTMLFLHDDVYKRILAYS